MTRPWLHNDPRLRPVRSALLARGGNTGRGFAIDVAGRDEATWRCGVPHDGQLFARAGHAGEAGFSCHVDGHEAAIGGPQADAVAVN